MPDVPQPAGLPPVEPRQDGRAKSGPDNRAPQPRRVAETYQEADRVRPAEDRVTIIGIPIEQITASTRAALAGLVAENATLRAQVRRLETHAPTAPPVLGRDAFLAQVGELTTPPSAAGTNWLLFVVHVQTYEDIRRSTGLLAANSVLADVAQRLRQASFAQDQASSAPAIPVTLVGTLGGLSLGALVNAPAGSDAPQFARRLQEQLTTEGYDVAGLSMALAIKVAAAAVSVAESPLLAVARVDHLTRGPQVAG